MTTSHSTDPTPTPTPTLTVSEGDFAGSAWRLARAGKRCVVLVNGVGMDMGLWLPGYVTPLSAAGYSVLTFNHEEIRDPRRVKSVTVGELAQRTAALLNHLNITQPVLLGTSLGAFVSQALATQIDVRALVLLGTYGEPGPLQRRLIEAEAEIYESGVAVPESYMVAMDLLQGCSRAQLLNDANFDKVFNGFRASTDYDDLSRRAAFFAARGYAPGVDHLRSLRCPTLVVGFEEDLLTPTHRCRQVADAIEGADYLQVAGAGHFGALTHAREIVPSIIEFLTRAVCCSGSALAPADLPASVSS